MSNTVSTKDDAPREVLFMSSGQAPVLSATASLRSRLLWRAEDIDVEGPAAAKAIYVSPFMGMEMDYEFRGHAPGERLSLTIDGMDDFFVPLRQ